MSEIKNHDIKSILYEVSKFIVLPKFKNLKSNEIKLKNGKDLVTSVDIDVENNLRPKLLKLLPNSLFVGEESFSKNPKIIDSYSKSQFCWTVDPIDGTKNFINGKDKFAIMIGLTFKKKIIQSWIYKPLTEELYHSRINDGSYVDDRKVYINNTVHIDNAIGSISKKYWEGIDYKQINNIEDNFKKIDSYGCIGFEYIDIGMEIRNFAILSKLSPWDHIPGILFVKEAGGSILHFDQTEYNHLILKNNLIVAGSKILQNEICNLIGGKNEF